MSVTAKKQKTSIIYTRSQLAEELEITEARLANWEEEHDFPGRRVGRTTLYDIEAIRAWIKAGR